MTRLALTAAYVVVGLCVASYAFDAVTAWRNRRSARALEQARERWAAFARVRDAEVEEARADVVEAAELIVHRALVYDWEREP